MKKAKKGPSGSPNTLLAQAQKGSIHSLAQLLSFAESDLDKALEFISAIKPGKAGKSGKPFAAKKTMRWGITGPPGAGKSSLLKHIISVLRKKDLRVAAILVDPSSPFTGGALLGDRVRMGELATDSKVFIRSVGSRGGFGGLSAATGVMARIFENCGFDVILIETVGVGQTELEIMNLVDVVSVVLVPESGDVIQTLKAGILEIADIFIVNKSDRPGAELIAQDLRAMIEQTENSSQKVFLTSAKKNTGIVDVVTELSRLAPIYRQDKNRAARRKLGELRHFLLYSMERKVSNLLLPTKLVDDPVKLYLKLNSKI
jgi:LAO/AO transport system kinase